MITEKRIKEIRKALRKGVPAGELITDLKEEGFSDEEIENVFHVAPARKGALSSENSFLTLASIGFIILGGTLLLGPPLWLQNYGYFFLIAGLIGVIASRLLTLRRKS